MRFERYLGAVLASFCFPGFGQGLAGRRVLMIVLAVADIAIFALALRSVWALLAGLVLRVVGTLDAALRLRRPVLMWNRTLPAIAVVACAIGLGYVQLESTAFRVPSSSMYPTIEIGDHLYIDKLSFALRSPRRGELIAFEHPCQDRVYLKRVVAIAGDTVEVRCNVLYLNGTAVSETLIEGDSCHYDDHDELDGRAIPRACTHYRQTLDGVQFDTFHDADRLNREKAGIGDMKDFPQLDGVRMPPSCATQMDGEPLRGGNQLPGKLVATPATGVCAPQLHYVVPEHSVFTLGDNRSNSNDSRYWGSVPLDRVIGRVVGIWLPTSRFGDLR